MFGKFISDFFSKNPYQIGPLGYIPQGLAGWLW
jgi:hypothetical protein